MVLFAVDYFELRKSETILQLAVILTSSFLSAF